MSAAGVLAKWKAGGDRDDLLYSLRDVEDVPAHLWNALLSNRETGSDILLPVLKGAAIVARRVAGNLCCAEGGVAIMMVMDSCINLFLAYETDDDNHNTLVLTCERDDIEEAAWELYGHRYAYGDDDEEVSPELALPQLLPYKASSIGGGTGFHEERLAGYMASFEPDKDGLWYGEQVVTASECFDIDDYNPQGNDPNFPIICLDIAVKKTRHRRTYTTTHTGACLPSDGACLILQSTRDEREDKQLTEEEDQASRYYAGLLVFLYKDIRLDELPPPGALRRGRIRYPHVLLRELVKRGRATPLIPHLKFIYKDSPAEIFALVLQSL